MNHFICHYCHLDPGGKPDNPHIWNGYRDAACKFSVCYNPECQANHDIFKRGDIPGEGRTYDEMPIVIPPPTQITHEMNTTQLLQSIPLDKISIWRNTRTDTDAHAIAELAESIARHGVIQPIVVRPHKGKSGSYQLVCGHRRFEASQLAAKTHDIAKQIPASIRDLNDDDALDLQLIENLQRKDVHPMDEASTFKQMLDTKRYTIQDIAAKIAKPETFVVARLKLNDLIPELKKDFRSNHFAIAHATLMARLTSEDQKELLSRAKRMQVKEYGSATDLEAFIQRNVIRNLSSAPFKKDDDALVPSAGPCTTCPKRSGANALLFPDIKEGDRCFDSKCFLAKSTAHLVFKVVEVIEQEPDIYLIKSAYRDVPKSIADLCRSHNVKILSEYSDFYERQKNSKGAVRAIWISGDEAGKYAYIELNSKNGKSSSSKTTTDKPTPAGFDLRIADIKAREVRAKELDSEKVHHRVKEELLKHKEYMESEDALSNHEIIALLILLSEHCSYQARTKLKSLLKVDGYNSKKTYDKLISITSDERVKKYLNLIARTAITDKLMAMNDDPFKSGTASCIRRLALDYMFDTVEKIDTEQSEKAAARAARVKKRIAEVAAEKKAFIAPNAKKVAPGAKKIASHAKPSSSRKSIKQLVS